MIDKIKNHKRRIIQLASAVIYNINIKGFETATIYQGNLKKICVPGLNCYSCPGAIASCPLGSIQKMHGMVSLYLIGLLLLFGITFGRIICGFLCPFGLIQELLYKLKTVKIKKNNFTYKCTYIKYFILLLCIVIFPFITNTPIFCKYICPVGTLEAGVYFAIASEKIRDILGLLFTWKMLILVIIITMSVFMYRFFCRFICPLGAFYGLFNKISVFGLKVDSKKCISCNKCINVCKLDVKKVGDRECINCGNCISVCDKNAIR